MEIFRGASVLVAGAASGIGRALCLKLAAAGASIIAGDIDEKGAASTAGTAVSHGGGASSIRLDVASEESVLDAVRHALDRYGRLDYLFNCAAICVTGDLLDLTADECCRVLEVNLHGTVRLSMAAYRVMAGQGGGHIVNVSSMAGFAPFAMNTAYTASKYGIVGFTAALGYEARDSGVRVSLVCPGIVGTEFYEHADIRNVERGRYTSGLPKRMMTAEAAALKILKGVANNKSLILFPFHARALRFAARFFPGAIGAINSVMVKKFRTLRDGNPGSEVP